MKQPKLKPDVRLDTILSAALDVSESVGYSRATREQIAERAQCSPGLVSHYLGTMKAARRDIMRHAIKQERALIVAQGLAARDPHALKAPDDLKQAASRAVLHD